MPRLSPRAERSSRGFPATSEATPQPCPAAAHRSYTRTAAGWRPGWSSVLFALAVLDERLNIVIVQPRFVTHGGWFDPQRAARLAIDTHQSRSQQIVERVPERRSS